MNKMYEMFFNLLIYMTLMNAVNGMVATTMKRIEMASAIETPISGAENARTLAIYTDEDEEYIEATVKNLPKICVLDVKDLCFINLPSIGMFEKEVHQYTKRYIVYDETYCTIDALHCKQKLNSQTSYAPNFMENYIPPKKFHDFQKQSDDQDTFSEEFVLFENLPNSNSMIIYERHVHN